MSRTFTKQEAAYILKCSVSTIENYCDYLKIYPSKGDRGRNLYSQTHFNLLKQLREHCSDKTKSRDSFVPTTSVEIVEDDVIAISRIAPTISKVDHYQESLELGLSQDPLFDLQILQRISDNHWLLPASRLAPILNLTAKYLNTMKHYEYCGFFLNKEVYSGGRSLWKVSANNS
jgi:hypothetical protein